MKLPTRMRSRRGEACDGIGAGVPGAAAWALVFACFLGLPQPALAQSRASLYINTAREVEMRGDVDLALQYLDRAVNADPASGQAYLGRAFVQMKKGHYDAAFDDFAKVIELEPKNPANYLSRGLALSQRGAKERAVADFRKGCELGDESACDFLNELQAK